MPSSCTQPFAAGFRHLSQAGTAEREVARRTVGPRPRPQRAAAASAARIVLLRAAAGWP